MNIEFRKFKHKQFMLLVTSGESHHREENEQVLLDH
jgi:hypothetical protein